MIRFDPVPDLDPTPAVEQAAAFAAYGVRDFGAAVEALNQIIIKDPTDLRWREMRAQVRGGGQGMCTALNLIQAAFGLPSCSGFTAKTRMHSNRGTTSSIKYEASVVRVISHRFEVHCAVSLPATSMLLSLSACPALLRPPVVKHSGPGALPCPELSVPPHQHDMLIGWVVRRTAVSSTVCSTSQAENDQRVCGPGSCPVEHPVFHLTDRTWSERVRDCMHLPQRVIVFLVLAKTMLGDGPPQRFSQVVCPSHKASNPAVHAGRNISLPVSASALLAWPLSSSYMAIQSEGASMRCQQ